MRRPRSLKEQARKSGQHPAPLILVVTEGTETEPRYFQALRAAWRLSGVKINASSTSAPIHAVETAIRLRDEARWAATRSPFHSPFDQVWVVIDQDQHTTLDEALTLARREGVKVALSRPCFELWILLHFIASLKPMVNAQQVEAELLGYLPCYTKSLDSDQLIGLVEQAVANALVLEAKLKEPGREDYPVTTVHHLIKVLVSMRRES